MDNNTSDLRARRRTAFHEAGHAVVGWALGLKVGDLRLEDDYNGKALIQLADHLPPVDQVAVCMGGRCGADLSGVARIQDHEMIGDEANVIIIAKREFPDDQEAWADFREQGLIRAETIVMRHVDLVTSIAEELERCGEIPHIEVARLLPPPDSSD
jgi:hypothetical protein